MLRKLVLIALLTLTAQPLSASENWRTPYVKPLFEQLLVLGMGPELDNDGDILFRQEQRTYVLIFDDSDHEFIMLALPNVWSIESELERAQVRAAIDVVNMRAKVARMLERNDNVWVTSEAFYAEPAHAVGVIERLIGALDSALALFASEMLAAQK